MFFSPLTPLTQAEIQRHFAQEILRISLFIYYKNIHFAQEFSWKMSKNFSQAIGDQSPLALMSSLARSL